MPEPGPVDDANNTTDPGKDPSQDLQRLAAFLSEGTSALGSEAGYVKNNVEAGRYDARLFRELVEASEELRGLAKAHDAPRTFGPLVLDLFLHFYKFVPTLVDAAEVDPAHLKANRPFIERMREDEQTAIARLSTATDEVTSSLATIEAARRILAELRRRPDLADWIERASQSETSPEPPAEGPTPHGAAQSRKTWPDASGEPDENLARSSPDPSRADPPPASQLRAAARSAANAASGDAAEHAAAMRGWGLAPADLRVADSLAERIELARKLRTRRTRDLADLLGRMRNQRRTTERRKVRANRDEVHSVETGGDISRALPSEIAAAFGSGSRARRLDFYRRLSERSVLSHSLRTAESVGRGPIIAMIDASYSMSGSPMEWASAVALALAQAASGAAGSARRVKMVFFNAKVVLEVEMEPGERDVRKFLSIANVEASGGTDYVPPISRALEMLAGEPLSAGSPDTTPDLLLVTDGMCELPEDHVRRLAAEKARGGFKLVSVLVGGHASPGSLEPFSERIITARDLAAASGARNAAGEVFESL